MSVSVYDSVDLTMAVNNLDSFQKNSRIMQLFAPGGVHTSKYLEWGYDVDYPHILYTRKDIEGSLPIEMKIGDLNRISFPKFRSGGVFNEPDARKLDPAVSSYMGTDSDVNSNLEDKIAKHLAKLRRDIDSTHIVNCITALLTGSATYKYEDGTSATITFNFGSAGTDPDDIIRTANSSGTLWSASTSTPVEDLEKMATAIRATTGYIGPLDVIMGTNAWGDFRRHASVTTELDNRRIVGNEIRTNENSEYKGNVNGFDIYHATYNYLLNTTYTEAFTATKVAMVPRDNSMGWFSTEYGAPFDFPEGSNTAQFIPVPYFAKNVRVDDPPAQQIIVESRPAPLIKNNLAVRVQTVTG